MIMIISILQMRKLSQRDEVCTYPRLLSRQRNKVLSSGGLTWDSGFPVLDYIEEVIYYELKIQIKKQV